MASATAQLKEVDALRQARLEALQHQYHLEQANYELGQLQQHAAPPHAPTVPQCCATAGDLQEARLQAADNKLRADLAELELVKQMDALQELQWQLDCVVAQLGLQPPPVAGSNSTSAEGDGGAAATAATAVDHMLLLSKVEELRAAQLQLDEYKRRLAFTEGELAAAERRCAHLAEQQTQQFDTQQRNQSPGGDAQHVQHPILVGDRELGAGGRELVAELLQENEQLRSQLGQTEERYQGLERDYEVELLLRAKAEEQMAAHSSQADLLASPTTQQGADTVFAWHHEKEMKLSKVHRWAAAGDSYARDSPSHRRGKQQPASPSMEHIARKRLEVRLQDKVAQLKKLRGVVQQLEGKLIDAYKRQADLVMRESSWREQEAQDRRIAQLNEDKARLAFAAQAAQAEADAAHKEAAAQRRLVKRLQQQAVAEQEAAAGGGSSSHVVELLQKRVKVLEAQCMRLRLQVKNRKEEDEEEAAAAAAAAARRRQAARGGSALTDTGQAAENREEDAGSVAAENDSPNKDAASGRLLEGNPVLEQWQAGKRLQKKVEALQTKLRDKTTALVSAQAGRSRAEEQVAQLQAQVQQCQASLKQLQVQLRQAEQRSEPGAMVPVAQWRDVVLQLEQAQERYNSLERQYAALQQRVPGVAGGADGGDVNANKASHAEPTQSQQHTPTADMLAATSSAGCVDLSRSSSRRRYCPAPYGGSSSVNAAAPADNLPARLLEKDVQLFDAHLQRDQAVAEAESHKRRLHVLLDGLSPHPHDEAAAVAIVEARQLAGLSPIPARQVEGGFAASTAATGSIGPPATGAASAKLAAGSKAGGGKRQQPGAREQELLDTIALLKSALERTKKGLESGVSSAKYMQAVDRVKQLRAQVQQLEERLADATKVREELARVRQQLGTLHATNSALKSQLKALKEQREDAASAREHMLSAQVAELERTLRERDAQMEALNASTSQVDEEVRVLVAEGLHPADLIQELLVLRPHLRDLEQQNASLQAELAAFDAQQFAQQLDELAAEHGLLRQRCERWEEEIRELCQRHDEPLPLGLS